MRKAAAVLTLISLLLTLPGCGTLLGGEYSSSREHESVSGSGQDSAELTFEADNYRELCQAVESLVSQGAERGLIRAAGYPGNLEADLADACLAASNNTALGAYCVYFINYSLNRLVSVYEASVSVIYRHTPEEAARIPVCEDETRLEELMRSALEARAESVTVKLIGGDLDGEAVGTCVENAYYSNPGAILYIPTYTFTAYPETGEERILEIALAYPYATSTVELRRRSLAERAGEIAGTIPAGTNQERLMALAEFFRENVEYDGTVDTSDSQARRYNAMTAYGALYQGRAAGEGYAMGLKVLCDILGIECYVIRGRHYNMDHAWNLVRLDNGELYHVDMTAFDPEAAPLKNDDQQRYAGYWWDATLYPWCYGPSLYSPEFDPPEDNPGPTSPPAGWDTTPARGQ